MSVKFQRNLNLGSNIFDCFGGINFKLVKFPYFKVFFLAALIDIRLLVLIEP